MKQKLSNALSARPLSPESNTELPSVFVKHPLLQPNIFRRRIDRIEGQPKSGDWVAVYALTPPTHHTAENHPGREPAPHLFAYGLYNDRSEVAVRLYRWSDLRPDDPYWDGLLVRALELRRDCLKLDEVTDAYRMIHGESDGFPGIVVDRYGDCLSAEVFSLGMYQRAEVILEKLAVRLETQHTLIQPAPAFLSQEGFDAPPIASTELPNAVTIQEYGTKFRIHFESGHKTGFFCDQRENRKRLSELCQGKTVLDLCCYTGGFSVQAARLGKASDVTGVDIDQAPLELAAKNANINQVRVRWVQTDVFAFMRDMLRIGRKYDVVVLDPPKLIRNRSEIEEGTRKHADLNRLAMQLVKPGGLMLSCSCAGLLNGEEFVKIVRSAARASSFDEVGKPKPPRDVQILSRPGAAADHPVSVHCPETEYLKSIWMRVS